MSAICLLFGQCFRIFTTISKPSCILPPIIRNVCTITKICTTSLDITAHTNNKTGTLISLQHIGQFPVDCQHEPRELAITNQVVMNNWFDNSGITIGSMADTVEKQNLNNRLLYIWRECFAKTLRDV